MHIFIFFEKCLVMPSITNMTASFAINRQKSFHTSKSGHCLYIFLETMK
jgi:hypothetical protein